MSNQPRRRRAEYFADAEPAALPPVTPDPGDEPYVPHGGQEDFPPYRNLMATNTGVRLACTMSAMMGFFALFLCWAEQGSRVIRRFSVQSVCLSALNLLGGVVAAVICWVLGGIPFLGLMVKLVCLLAYIGVAILLLVTRLRLMRSAWQGMRFSLPEPIEKIIHRYY